MGVFLWVNLLDSIICKNNIMGIHSFTEEKVTLRRKIEGLQSDMEKNTISPGSIRITQEAVGMRYLQFGININEVLCVNIYFYNN